MTITEIADAALKLLQSGAIVTVGVLILKAFREQINAANAIKNVKDETISALKEAHASEVAALKAQLDTLKEQRDFGSNEAREIREADMKTLERRVQELKKEKEELAQKLDDTRSDNEKQIDKNNKLAAQMRTAQSTAQFEFNFDEYITSLDKTNELLADNNLVLKYLSPRVVAHTKLPGTVLPSCGFGTDIEGTYPLTVDPKDIDLFVAGEKIGNIVLKTLK